MAEPLDAGTRVAFEVGGAMYALDIRHVREILRPLSMDVLPHAPPMVVGVFDHRGDVVPVIDLRVRFGLAAREHSRTTRWIIVTRAGGLCSLVVDSVHEVFSTAHAQPRQVPVVAGADERGVVCAYAYRERLIFEVDVMRITETTNEPVARAAQASARGAGSELP
jgi:purine-binding chemotaxis protein CheW